MLEIKLRDAKLGTGYNGRSEMSGPDEVNPGLDITVKNVFLKADEVDQFVTGFSTRFFNENKEPQLTRVYPVVLKDKIEGATVVFKDGAKKLKLTDCKICKVNFVPAMDCVTKISFQLQFHPKPGEADWLMTRLRKEVQVSIVCEQYNTQTDLTGEAA